MDTTEYDVKRLDHLGLVAGFCKEAGLADDIDELGEAGGETSWT